MGIVDLVCSTVFKERWHLHLLLLDFIAVSRRRCLLVKLFLAFFFFFFFFFFFSCQGFYRQHRFITKKDHEQTVVFRLLGQNPWNERENERDECEAERLE